jgi:hypothetical protein
MGGYDVMRWLKLSLAAYGLLFGFASAEAADQIEYSVTVTGGCQYQILVGWDNCQSKVVYTHYKGDKYSFEFIDKNNNTYVFFGKRDRQIDNSNLFSNIDTIQATTAGKTSVDSQAMGGCTTKITPAGDKFIYIDCAVTDSKNMLFKFRISNITEVLRAFSE